MKLIIRKLFFILLLISFCSIGYAKTQINDLEKQMPNLDPKVLTLALDAYEHAQKQGLDDRSIITIVDYTLPSTKKRLWVIDLKDNNLLYNTLVTHGRSSGSLYARRFSNKFGSYESSIGLYLTGGTYYGHIGYAMRLYGLDKGYNDNAEKRAIVVHGAVYADPSFIAKYGRLGRSLGCFALPEKMYRPIIDTIKNGTLVFSYYPDESWLSHSKYL